MMIVPGWDGLETFRYMKGHIGTRIHGMGLWAIMNYCHEMLNALIPAFVPDFKWISLVSELGRFTEYVGAIIGFWAGRMPVISYLDITKSPRMQIYRFMQGSLVSSMSV